jgi:transcriptional regulator with XRE-family HTH domain
MLSDLLRRDRRRLGLSVGQVAWRLGVKVPEYRELEAGTRWPSWDAFDRAARLYGWPQTFIGAQET